jgi:hypothetical protein
MVARPWNWDTAYMAGHFGWRAALAIAVSNVVYLAIFWKDLAAMATAPGQPAGADREDDPDERATPVPFWVTLTNCLFMAWTVAVSHYPALVIGGFLIFLGYAKVTAAFQGRFDLKSPLLVGFFLGGLVIHGGLQGWWIQPFLGSLTEGPLFFGSILLTAFNDNAMITYLATLVPSLGDQLKVAVVAGAVVGGGLTVIANAPNPAGQSLLSRYFGGAIAPAGLFAGALLPTIIAAMAFYLI